MQAVPDSDASGAPTISVVVCAFTAERLEALGEAIASIRAQTSPPLETILVIDHNDELMAESEERWPDLRIVANREKQGLSGARNTGVAEATGEVVAFLDDDAAAAADWLQRLAAAYADPGVVGTGGTVRPRWLAGKPGWFPPEFDWVVGCTHSGMPSTPSPVRNPVGANMSFRREALLAVGGFSESLGRVGALPVGCEETDLSIRIGQRRPSETILFDPEASVDHRVPAGRSHLRYFLERCWAEGHSKAILTGMVGAQEGLASERSYTLRTLPLGVLGNLRDAAGGDLSGLGRAAMIVLGLATTTASYLRTRATGPGPTRAGAGDWPRILMVTPRSPLGHGGVERHVMEVSRRIRKADGDVEVLCADPDIRGVSTQEHDGVPIAAVRAWPADRDFYLAPRLWREIGRRAPDVIHVQSYHTLVAPLAMLRALFSRIPYVVTFHGGGHSSELRNRMRGLQLRLLRPLLARAARLVAVARFEIDQYGSALGIPAERFVLIPNGTDLEVGEVGDADGPPTLATIGRLERYKGHDRVLAAFPAVLESRPDARLLVVGKGPYEDELRRQAEELGIGEQVEFTSVPPGDPTAMAAMLSRISLVVLLSEFETHPLVALEAAAARRRLLVADSGGLSELAADGFARAVPADEEPAAVAQAILQQLEEPPPAEAPKLSTWDDCAIALLDLYRSVM
jgi:glycosyltransferase involved in cell wall biosynthesis